MQGLAIAGDDGASTIFREVYRTASSDDLKQAVLEAMLIEGDEESALELFRESNDPAEKRELLVHMDSDAVWEIVDATLKDD